MTRRKRREEMRGEMRGGEGEGRRGKSCEW